MRKAVRKGMKTARRGSATPETRGPRLEDRALPSDGPSRAASPLRCATIWGSQSISAVQRLQLMHDFQVFFFSWNQKAEKSWLGLGARKNARLTFLLTATTLHSSKGQIAVEPPPSCPPPCLLLLFPLPQQRGSGENGRVWTGKTVRGPSPGLASPASPCP